MRPSGEVTNTASFMLSSMMSSARPVAAWSERLIRSRSSALPSARPIRPDGTST